MGGNDEVHFPSFLYSRPRMQNFEERKKINFMVYMHTKITVYRKQRGKVSRVDVFIILQ